MSTDDVARWQLIEDISKVLNVPQNEALAVIHELEALKGRKPPVKLHPTAEELQDDCEESCTTKTNIEALADKIASERGYVKPDINMLEDMPSLGILSGESLRVSILEEAQSLVHGARNKTYGNPWEDYGRTVGAFKALMGDKKISDMTAEDGIMFMVCVKLSRQVNLPKRDNLVDAAGYLECLQWSIDSNLKNPKQEVNNEKAE